MKMPSCQMISNMLAAIAAIVPLGLLHIKRRCVSLFEFPSGHEQNSAGIHRLDGQHYSHIGTSTCSLEDHKGLVNQCLQQRHMMPVIKNGEWEPRSLNRAWMCQSNMLIFTQYGKGCEVTGRARHPCGEALGPVLTRHQGQVGAFCVAFAWSPTAFALVYFRCADFFLVRCCACMCGITLHQGNSLRNLSWCIKGRGQIALRKVEFKGAWIIKFCNWSSIRNILDMEPPLRVSTLPWIWVVMG